MQAFVDLLRSFFQSLQMWVIINPWERGLRTRLGKHIKVLQPGIHIMLPIIDETLTLTITPQIINLPNQSVNTSDSVAVAISGAVEYGIIDVRRAMLNVQDFDESLQNLAMGITAHFVAEREYHECELIDLEEQICAGIREACESWGLDVRRVYLTDFVEHKVYRVMSDDAPSLIPEDDD